MPSRKFYTKYLPVYLNIAWTKFQLAIWSEQSDWESTRITIRDRQDGSWLGTLKAGNYPDKRYYSVNFWKNWWAWKNPSIVEVRWDNGHHRPPEPNWYIVVVQTVGDLGTSHYQDVVYFQDQWVLPKPGRVVLWTNLLPYHTSEIGQ